MTASLAAFASADCLAEVSIALVGVVTRPATKRFGTAAGGGAWSSDTVGLVNFDAFPMDCIVCAHWDTAYSRLDGTVGTLGGDDKGNDFGGGSGGEGPLGAPIGGGPGSGT